MAYYPQGLRRLGTLLGQRPVLLGVMVGAVGFTCGVWALIHNSPRPQGSEHSLIVKPHPFSTSIDVVGNVTPGESVNVTAPFDGTLKVVRADFGGNVTTGSTLFVMDTFDIQQKHNDALTAYLKAAQSEAEMADWTASPEVARARRGVMSAEQDLKETQRKLAESQDLFSRGLVARMEVDGLTQQQRSQQTALSTANEDLAVALQRGAGPNRAEAKLGLESAKARLHDIVMQQAGAELIAPASGIFVRPPNDKVAGDGGGLHVGQRVSKGQLLGAIAKAGVVAITARLSEADAITVHVGQPVMATGPGFGEQPFAGHISNISGEATPSDTLGGGATFTVTALLDGAPARAATTIRVGMTANLSIITYTNPRAIVVPPDALQGAGPNASLSVSTSGKKEYRPVKLGRAGPDGVEVLSGIRSGEKIRWLAPASK